MQLVHIHLILIAGTPSDAIFVVAGKFIMCKTLTTRTLPKELLLFCCVNVTGHGQ